jgi:hypothetical protein
VSSLNIVSIHSACGWCRRAKFSGEVGKRSYGFKEQFSKYGGRQYLHVGNVARLTNSLINMLWYDPARNRR